MWEGKCGKGKKTVNPNGTKASGILFKMKGICVADVPVCEEKQFANPSRERLLP
jgi:hypothetical protein